MPQVTRDFSIMGSTLKPAGNANASRMIGQLRLRQQLSLFRQPKNPVDPNAILVMWGTWPLGYVPRGLAAEVAPIMDAGAKVICQKAPNALYGVCTLAYIEPPPVTAELISVEEANDLYQPKEVPNAEPSPDADAAPREDI